MASALSLYLTGVFGASITNFFEDIFYDDIMESAAGKTLNHLISYDKKLYEEIDFLANSSASGTIVGPDGKTYDTDDNYLALVGIPEAYGFKVPSYHNEEGG